MITKVTKMNRVSLPFWPLLLLATHYLLLPTNASLYGYTNTTIVHYAYDPASEVATPASSSVFASSSGPAFATATVTTNVTSTGTKEHPEPTVSTTVTSTSTVTPSEPLQDVIRQEPGPFDGARSPSRAYDDTYQQLSDPPIHLISPGLASSDAPLDNYLDAHLARADSDSESPSARSQDFANDFMDSNEKSRRFFLSPHAKRIGTFAFGPLWPWNYGVACVVNEFPDNWNPHADPPRIDDLVERFNAAIETEHRKAEALNSERQRLEATRLEEEAVIKDLKRKNDVTDWYRSLLIEKVSEYDGLVDLNTYVRDDLLVKSKADQRKRAATSKVYVQAQTLYMRVKRTSDTINAASTALVIYQRPLYPPPPPRLFELCKPSTWRFVAVLYFFLCLATLFEFALYLPNERHEVPPTDPHQPGFPPGSFPPSDDDAPGSGDHQLHESLFSNLSSNFFTDQQRQDRGSRPGNGDSNGQRAEMSRWECVFMWVCALWSFCVLEVRNAKDEIACAASDRLHQRSPGTSGSSEARQDIVPDLVNDSVAFEVPQAAAQSINTETDAAITIQETEEEVHTTRSPSHAWQFGRQDVPYVARYRRRHVQVRRSRSPSPVTVQTREDHPVAEQSLAKPDRPLGAEVGLACVTTVAPSNDVRSVPDCDPTVSSADSEPVSETPLENASQSCIEPPLGVVAPSLSDTAIEEAQLDQISSTPPVREIVALVVSVDRDAFDPNDTKEELAIVEHADSSNEQTERSVPETPMENVSQSSVETPLVVMAPAFSDTTIEEAQLDQISSTPPVREIVALVVSVDRDAFDPNDTEEELAIVKHADSSDKQAEECTISVSALENSNDMDVVSMLEEQRPASALEPVVAFCTADTQDSARLPATKNTALELAVCLQNTPVATTSTTESFVVEKEKAVEVEHLISADNASVQAEEENCSTVEEAGQHAVDTTSKMASKEESEVLDATGSLAIGPQVEDVATEDGIAKSTEQETACTSGNAVVGEDIHAVDSTSATAMSSPVVADVAGIKGNPVPSSTPAPIDSTWSKLPDPTSKLIAKTPSVTMVPSPKSSAFSSTTYDREAPSAFSFSTYGEKTPFAFGPGTPLAPAVNTALVNTPQRVVNPFAKRPRGAPARRGPGSQASVSDFGYNSVFTKPVTSTAMTAGPESAFVAPAFRSPMNVTAAGTATTQIRSAEKRVNGSPQALTSSASAPPTNTRVANKAQEGLIPTRPSNSLLASAWAPRIDTQPTTPVPRRTSVAASPVAQGSARLPLSSTKTPTVSTAVTGTAHAFKPSLVRPQSESKRVSDVLFLFEDGTFGRGGPDVVKRPSTVMTSPRSKDQINRSAVQRSEMKKPSVATRSSDPPMPDVPTSSTRSDPAPRTKKPKGPPQIQNKPGPYHWDGTPKDNWHHEFLKKKTRRSNKDKNKNKSGDDEPGVEEGADGEDGASV
ncbi:hypothetical protein QFC24_000585 [Naganishia onofrii]|uniref:Uncharacterized protein n=1 Tax=Naganishia onofrii TaxID=1851511 RepID=A0ACC2XXT4_9TREE|nr:hypothetical protein QFC24_000585 [Naganishia onofrii]